MTRVNQILCERVGREQFQEITFPTHCLLNYFEIHRSIDIALGTCQDNRKSVEEIWIELSGEDLAES